MVLTILPAGRPARTRLLCLHGIGLFVGATLAAIVVLGLHRLLAPIAVRSAVLAATSLVGTAWIVRIAVGRGLRWPRSTWQVPESWRYSLEPEVTVSLYGALLGVAVLTNPILPTVWLWIALSILASPGAVLVSWACYAATRLALTAYPLVRASQTGTGDPPSEILPRGTFAAAKISAYGVMIAPSVLLLLTMR